MNKPMAPTVDIQTITEIFRNKNDILVFSCPRSAPAIRKILQAQRHTSSVARATKMRVVLLGDVVSSPSRQPSEEGKKNVVL